MFIVAETVQHFITTMDSVKLNMLAVDQVMSQAFEVAIDKSPATLKLLEI